MLKYLRSKYRVIMTHSHVCVDIFHPHDAGLKISHSQKYCNKRAPPGQTYKISVPVLEQTYN